jgi:hypothetical protein
VNHSREIVRYGAAKRIARHPPPAGIPRRHTVDVGGKAVTVDRDVEAVDVAALAERRATEVVDAAQTAVAIEPALRLEAKQQAGGIVTGQGRVVGGAGATLTPTAVVQKFLKRRLLVARRDSAPNPRGARKALNVGPPFE